MTDDPHDPAPDGVPANDPVADDTGEDTAGTGGFWAADEHDEAGLDLARTIARAVAGAATDGAARTAGRRTPRRRRRDPGDRDRSRGSGAHPDERDPQLLDTSLGRLVADQGWALDLRAHSAFGRWPAIVGEEVAQHCHPVSLVDGKLVVRADSTAWATQLRLLAPTLVRRLNEELGHGSVTLIEVEGPNVPTWKRGRYGVRDGRGPRDTYG